MNPNSGSDIGVANSVALDSINSFKIHEIGWNPSDHFPISVVFTIPSDSNDLMIRASREINYIHDIPPLVRPKKLHPDMVD